MNDNDAPKWFFMWKANKPYITTICGWSRRGCIEDVERFMGCPWRQTYRKGGRVIKVKWSFK